MRKAKQLEYLISVLPTIPPGTAAGTAADDTEDAELTLLEEEMKLVNSEYLDALAQAGVSSPFRSPFALTAGCSHPLVETL